LRIRSAGDGQAAGADRARSRRAPGDRSHHEHYDHIRGADAIARKLQIPIYLSRGTLNASNIDPTDTPTILFDNNSTFRVGELNVHACRTIHDAADPSCFVIEARDGTRVGIASDLDMSTTPCCAICAAATACSSSRIMISTCCGWGPIRGR